MPDSEPVIVRTGKDGSIDTHATIARCIEVHDLKSRGAKRCHKLIAAELCSTPRGRFYWEQSLSRWFTLAYVRTRYPHIYRNLVESGELS